MSDPDDALLNAFIRSEASPDGKWWVEVPVGLSVGGEHATLDAVCLTSRDQELPESYTEHHDRKYVVHEQDEHLGVDRADAFDALRTKDTFAEETAVIVAVEAGRSSVGTVGDLLAHETLLLADWNWTVEERILLSDTDSDSVNHVCEELSVRPMRVA